MTSNPEKYIINKCIDNILEWYIKYNNCHVVKLNPFDDKSKEFSIVYEGYTPLIDATKVAIQDKGIERIFLFQIHSDYNGCYTDDWFLTRTDHYLYKGELTEYPEKDRFLYECDSSCTAIPDPVNHPNHYEMVGPFESFDIIVESLGIDGARQFCQGNIIKYQTRYREKNGEEDLEKRHWYSRMDQMLAKCETIKDYYKLKESDF